MVLEAVVVHRPVTLWFGPKIVAYCSPAVARVVAVLPLTNLELEQGVSEKQVADFLVLLSDGTGREVDATVSGSSHPTVQLVVTPVVPTEPTAAPSPAPAPAASPGS